MQYLQRIYTKNVASLPNCAHYNMDFLKQLNLIFDTSVTFFVGENGCGKTTLLKAIASICNLPCAGGSRNELADPENLKHQSSLDQYLGAEFSKKPKSGYFFRTERLAKFSELLDQRNEDPDFRRTGDPYAMYGGETLQNRSHGEAVFSVFNASLQEGIVILDEPETALSTIKQRAHYF